MVLFAVFILLSGFAASQNAFRLTDGVSMQCSQSDLFSFFVYGGPNSELLVILTSFAGNTVIYASNRSDVSPANYEWSSQSSNQLLIPLANITIASDVFIWVECRSSFCRYSLAATALWEMTLIPGDPANVYLMPDRPTLLDMTIANEPMSDIGISLSCNQDCEGVELRTFIATQNSREEVPYLPSMMRNSYRIANPHKDEMYIFELSSSIEQTASVLVTFQESAVLLQSQRVLQDYFPVGGYKLYRFLLDDTEATIKIMLTVFSGITRMMVKKGGIPTETDWDFVSRDEGLNALVITKDDRTQQGVGSGEYILKVFSYYSPCHYSLSFSVERSAAVVLLFGVPQYGCVSPSDSDYYIIDIPSGDWNVTVTLITVDSDGTLSGGICHSLDQDCISEMEESPKKFNIWSHYSMLESATFPHRESDCLGRSLCRYGMKVTTQGIGLASYRVLVGLDEWTKHVLTSGQAVKIAQGVSTLPRWFIFTVLNSSVAEVTFKITQFSGETYFYATRNCSNDNFIEYEKQPFDASLRVSDFTFRRGIDGESLVGSYCLAVSSGGLVSEYSLVALEHTPNPYADILTILSGYPQLDTLYNNEGRSLQIFNFSLMYVNEPPQSIQIFLHAIRGRFNLLVGNPDSGYNKTAGEFQYEWSRFSIEPDSHNNTLVIDPNDEFYRPTGQYQILVTANQWDWKQSASYLLSYKSGDGIAMLQDGTEFSEELIEGEPANFKFALHRRETDIKVRTTLFAGQADVFLSFSRLSPRPTADSWDYYFFCTGSSVYIVHWYTTLSWKCKDWPCYIYISARTRSRSLFAIKVSTASTAPERLRVGYPLSGAVEKDEFAYYSVFVAASGGLDIVLTSHIGDSDLYVYTQYSFSDRDPEWRLPNREEYTHTSQSGGTIDRVIIEKEAESYRSNAVAIGVLCRSDLCKFSLSASQSTLVILEGVTQHVILVQNQTRYFQFFCSADAAEITLRLTPMGTETLRMYVSKGEAMPNATRFDWMMEAALGKQMKIWPGDESIKGKSMKGEYVAMVEAITGAPTYFALTYLTNATAVVMLLPGVPLVGQNYGGEISYFSFSNYRSADLVISTAHYQGMSQLFVSPAGATLPSPTSSTWSSQSYIEEVYISHLDPRFCIYCDYIIAVFGLSTEQVYTITAKNLGDITLLMNGVPMQGFVESGEQRRYVMQIEKEMSVDVAVVSFSGNADLFVGSDQYVSLDQYLWKSTNSDKIDHIHITADEISGRVQSLIYFDVFGVRNSSFSITAHMQDSYIHLIDGWPMTYSIERDKNDHLFFDFHVPAGVTDTTKCALRPLVRGFFPKVYVSFQPSHAQAVKPAPGIADDSYEHRSDYETAIGELTIPLYGNFTDGKHNIGVYSRKEDSAGLGVFSLTCASSLQPSVLTQGQAAFGLLSKSVTLQRYVYIVDPKGVLEVSVMPCSGRVRLEISTKGTVDAGSDQDVTIATLADGRLFGTILQAQGAYLITVSLQSESDLFPGATFEILSETRGHSTPSFQSGNDGVVTWKQMSSHRFRFHWSPPENADGRPLDFASQVRYRLFFSYSRTVPMKTTCGIAVGEMNSMVFQPANHPLTGQTSFVLFLPQLVPVQVVVIAYIDTPEREIAIPYPSVFIDIKPRSWSVGWYLLVAAVGITAVSCGAIVIVARKYRSTRRKLEFELSEQRGAFERTTEEPQTLEKEGKDRRELT